MSDLLIEPFGGMAGDMLLAGLCDLEDSRFGIEELRMLADRLVPGEAKLNCSEVQRGSMRARMLSVETPESKAAPHRHLSDLLTLLDRADLPERARRRAGAVLRRIAEAESRVHGVSVEEIHFHEVGAVDTLIDVAGVVFALDALGIERVLATPPYVGGGRVQCAHGEMPVPAPATAEILKRIPMRLGVGGERLTPTGAALLAELAEFFTTETFIAERVGYGAGTRDPEQGPPNLVRVQLGQCERLPDADVGAPQVPAVQFEFHLDDATGEEIGHLTERLRAAGALDVWTSALQMKKGRPGILISGLMRPDRRGAIERVSFDHSTTLGLRFRELLRTECERKSLEVELDGKTVRVKQRIRPHAPGELSPADLSPEYEDLALLSRETGVSLRELEQRALAAALDQLRRRAGP